MVRINTLRINPSDHIAFRAAIEDLRCFGVEFSETYTQGADAYGIIGSRSNARWFLIPLRDRHVAARGLELFQPITIVARVLKAGMKTACILGLQRICMPSKIYVTGLEKFFKILPTEVESCSFFTGTDGPHRKTSVQFMGKESQIVGYGKLSSSCNVKPFIRAEANALSQIYSFGLVSSFYPKCLFLNEVNGSLLLLTDSLKGQDFSIPIKYGLPHSKFVHELSQYSRSNNLTSHVLCLHSQFEDCKHIMGKEWQLIIERCLKHLGTLANSSLPLSFSHGDFTPWNSFLTRGKLYVFDWEYACIRPVGYDLIHFHLASLRKLSPKFISVEVLEKLTSEVFAGDRNIARSAFLAYLCGHTLQYATREALGKSKTDGWDDASFILKFFKILL